MSNRDKFLLVVIGIAGVILLPYFLYIKDARDRIVNLDNEIIQLEARYQELLEYEKNREMYETGIVEYTEKRDAIIAKYPADIQQASQVMYLLNTEYSEYIEFTNADKDEIDDDDVVVTTIEPTIRFVSGSFNSSERTPINSSYLATDGEEVESSQLVETDFAALTNATELSFNCYDQTAVNHLLECIRDDEDNPMIYRTISFAMDEETGEVNGNMKLFQYAITGGDDREFVPLPVKPDIDEMDMRGNEHYGIFGPCSDVLYWEWIEAQNKDEDDGDIDFDNEDDDADDDADEDSDTEDED